MASIRRVLSFTAAIILLTSFSCAEANYYCQWSWPQKITDKASGAILWTCNGARPYCKAGTAQCCKYDPTNKQHYDCVVMGGSGGGASSTTVHTTVTTTTMRATTTTRATVTTSTIRTTTTTTVPSVYGCQWSWPQKITDKGSGAVLWTCSDARPYCKAGTTQCCKYDSGTTQYSDCIDARTTQTTTSTVISISTTRSTTSTLPPRYGCNWSWPQEVTNEGTGRVLGACTTARPYCKKGTTQCCKYDNVTKQYSDCINILTTPTTTTTLPTCTDSDADGYAHTRIGEVVVKNAQGTSTYTDYCSGYSVLHECYCGDGKDVEWLTYDCGELGCFGGRCNTYTCYDTDGGDKPSKAGYTVKMLTPTAQQKDYDTCTGNKVEEAYCDMGGTQKTYEFTCPNGCLNGACLITTTTTTLPCYDSDGGKTYYRKGYAVNKYNVVLDDFCQTNNPNRLSEYYCGGDQLALQDPYDCPAGCFEGACKATSTTTYTTTTTGTTTTATTTSTLPPGCYDHDGLDDGNVNSYIEYVENGRMVKLYDECSEPISRIFEAVCDGNRGTTTMINCLNGCFNGTCNVSFCRDTDGGNYPYVWGDVMDGWGGHTDECMGTMVVEQICSGGRHSYVLFNCSAGCSEHRCNPSTTTTTSTLSLMAKERASIRSFLDTVRRTLSF
ncbi:MAG: hypothetical protein V1875_07075 [Candidatus Altiarchaeota archaeon]